MYFSSEAACGMHGVNSIEMSLALPGLNVSCIGLCLNLFAVICSYLPLTCPLFVSELICPLCAIVV